MNTIITRPVITEKTLVLSQKGWYTFAVQDGTRKEHIAGAIKALYGVDPVSVRTIAMHGKMRHVGKSRKTVQKPDWKKALVKLKTGQHIDAFEMKPEKEEKAKEVEKK